MQRYIASKNTFCVLYYSLFFEKPYWVEAEYIEGSIRGDIKLSYFCLCVWVSIDEATHFGNMEGVTTTEDKNKVCLLLNY